MIRRNGLKLILAAAFAAITLLLSSVLAFAAEDLSSVSLYRTTLYNEENGIPTGEANAVCQTDDGFIWIGSYGGLQRYDGVNFHKFGTEHGLTSYSIRSLFVDSKGNLWVGSNDQGVFIYDGTSFAPVDTAKIDNYKSVRSFIEDNSGRVWMGTGDGIAYVEDSVLHVFDLNSYGIDNSTVYSISSFDGNTIWAVDNFGAIIRIDCNSRTMTGYYKPGDVWDDSVYAYSLVCATDGNIYVGTSGTKILCLQPGDKPSLVKEIDTGAVYSANAICETSFGDIVIGASNGIGIYTNGVYSDCSYIDSAGYLNCVIEDYEHNLWFASTKYGVIKVEHAKMGRLVRVPELSDKETFSICDTGDRKYIGYENGILVMDANWNRVESTLPGQLEGTHVHHIIEASNGKLYIGTYYAGLYIYDPETDELDNYEINGSRCRTVAELSDGRVVIGTEKGLDYFKGEELDESVDLGVMVLCVTEGKNGAVLCGTDGKGIIEVKNGVANVYAATLQGLSGGVILRLKPDSANPDKLWVSCGNDLFYGDRNGFDKTPALTQGSGSILDVFAEDKKIWLFRTSGILRCNRADLLGDAESISADLFYSSDSGLPGPVTANSFSAYDGMTFAICTVNGIGILDRDNLYLNSEKPKVAITDIVLSDGSKWDGSSSVKLGKNLAKMTIGFAALTYTGTDIQVKYMLEGLDDEFTVRNPQAQDEVEYTNLKRGTYRFKIRAVNADGVEGDELVMTFEKEPQFTETVWFFLILTLGAALIATGIAFIRINAMKRKQKMYKDLTDQTISTISGAIDAKDPYTQGHSKRVADFSVEIGKKMGMKEDECERLYYIALLHDIGKIGVPDDILKKPSRLSDDEFRVIKHHTEAGGEILKNFVILPGVADGAKYHHERYDGKGYGIGLKGKEIPLYARIISVADAYDAMNSSRCYRKALDKEIILGELEKGKGTQFDPDIADIAIELIKSKHDDKDDR